MLIELSARQPRITASAKAEVLTMATYVPDGPAREPLGGAREEQNVIRGHRRISAPACVSLRHASVCGCRPAAGWMNAAATADPASATAPATMSAVCRPEVNVG